MPETLFRIRWPDGACETCYSPSSIIAKHLTTGRECTVAEFVGMCGRGLRAASERVQEVYGGDGCSRAMAQLAAITARAERYEKQDIMHVESIGGALRRSA